MVPRTTMAFRAVLGAVLTTIGLVGCSSGPESATCAEYLAMSGDQRAVVIEATQNVANFDLGADFWLNGYDRPITEYCSESGRESVRIQDLYLVAR